ncbi:MAG: crossover junction endodeoxyribonuclease RuvC [Candidatus Pacebacteria bacterium]|nr:crossover junction endodeoxyribonuclease RuvC [Candidatus Paceibacterota bacterium]
MIVLGIDPGIALTGWGLVRKKANPELINFGCIKTLPEVPSQERLFKIFEDLEKIIKDYRPKIMVAEKLFFNTNAKTALAVGEARGVIKICAVRNRLPLVEFTPLQVKNSLTGYGRAEKKQIQAMVKILLGLSEIPQPDDAADALAVALTYCFYHPNLEK